MEAFEGLFGRRKGTNDKLTGHFFFLCMRGSWKDVLLREFNVNDTKKPIDFYRPFKLMMTNLHMSLKGCSF